MSSNNVHRVKRSNDNSSNSDNDIKNTSVATLSIGNILEHDEQISLQLADEADQSSMKKVSTSNNYTNNTRSDFGHLLKFEISMKFHKFNEPTNNDEFQNNSRHFIRCLNFQINKSNPNIVPNITNSIFISILHPWILIKILFSFHVFL